MSLGLYMDHHVNSVITEALRGRGLDVMTAHGDGRERSADTELLTRATELGRILFTRDRHFLIHCAAWQRQGLRFSGVVYAHQQNATIGQCVEGLELICEILTASEMLSTVIHLPFKTS
jgi:predicted nuclease of predicted toxin-antitoxin system